MAGIKQFNSEEVLDDDAAVGTDPDAMPDDEVDGASLILSSAAGVGKEAKVEQIIRNLVRKEVAEILRQKTIDLQYIGNENWVTSTGTNNLSILRGGVDADKINAITDWASSYTIPSGTDTNGALVVRLDKGENPNNYRLFNGIALNNVGDFNVPIFITSPTYDYYLSPVSLINRYATGETLIQHLWRGRTHYFHGVPEIENALNNLSAEVEVKQIARYKDSRASRRKSRYNDRHVTRLIV